MGMAQVSRSQGSPGAVPALAAPAPPVEVSTYGALRAIFHEAKTGPEVRLSSVSAPHLHAVGALSELRGEVSIVDGAIWLSYADDQGGIRVEQVQQSDEQATLLVAANVSRWRKFPIEEDISRDDLDAKLEALATARGVDVARAFPFRVEGPLANLQWHVIDGRKAASAGSGSSHMSHMEMAVSGTVPEATGTLVGFFSKHHHGVFTHMGSNSHLHVVLDGETRVMGHVDGVIIKKGATLVLP